MKRVLSLVCILFLSGSAFSQYYYFDFYNSPVDNELVNNFTVAQNYVQIKDSGITGGCIEVVEAINIAEAILDNPIQWQSNNKIELSLFYKFVQDSSSLSQLEGISMNIIIKDSNGYFNDSIYKTALKFDYNYVQNNPLPFTRFNFWMNSAAIINVYIADSFFVNHHWYKMSLVLDRNFTGDTVQYSYSIDDYGTNGLVKSREVLKFIDKHGWSESLKKSNEIKLKLRSNTKGSVRYIDNLNINQYPTNLFENTKREVGIILYPNPLFKELMIMDNFVRKKNIAIYDLTGKNIISLESPNKQTNIPFRKYASGAYIILIKNKKGEMLANQLIFKK